MLRVDDIQQPTTSGADDAEATFTTGTSLGDEIAATAAQNSRHDGLNCSAVSTSTPDHTPRDRGSALIIIHVVYNLFCVRLPQL